jgi:hypothetical protein
MLRSFSDPWAFADSTGVEYCGLWKQIRGVRAKGGEWRQIDLHFVMLNSIEHGNYAANMNLVVNKFELRIVQTIYQRRHRILLLHSRYAETADGLNLVDGI